MTGGLEKEDRARTAPEKDCRTSEVQSSDSNVAAEASVLGSHTGSIAPDGTLARDYARGSILKVLERDVLLTRVTTGPDGRVLVATQPWDRYWGPIKALGLRGATRCLEALQCIWRSHVADGFTQGRRRELCFRYFVVLDFLLGECEARPGCPLRRAALWRALAFECFGIVPAGSDEPVAAGTSTLRNPCYLLAKLKAPDALDATEYLPLVTAPGGGEPRLFYHYRRHKLSVSSDSSVLLYACAHRSERQESFRALASLQRQIGSGLDPRAAERATRIARHVIGPYLRGVVSCRGEEPQSPVDVELVDIGAGSGVLAACLCRQAKGVLDSEGVPSRFRVWMVDLSLADPVRFFAARKQRSSVDCLTAVATDYRSWLDGEHPLPRRNGIRIALLSCLFNNLSEVKTGRIATRRIARDTGGGPVARLWRDSLPTRCLAPDGPGPESLTMSSSPVWVASERALLQPSLLPYLRALDQVSTADPGVQEHHGDADSIVMPLRRLDPECLRTRKGASVLGKLLEHCSLVIVQDVDLTPTMLQTHGEQLRTQKTAAVDVTKTLGLKRHYAYALGNTSDRALRCLKGRALW